MKPVPTGNIAAKQKIPCGWADDSQITIDEWVKRFAPKRVDPDSN